MGPSRHHFAIVLDCFDISLGRNWGDGGGPKNIGWEPPVKFGNCMVAVVPKGAVGIALAMVIPHILHGFSPQRGISEQGEENDCQTAAFFGRALPVAKFRATDG